MKQELLLSVIVPIYNTQKYLEECLDSLLNQNITNYEIICINDGSTDKSLEILEKYSNNHSNIKLISQEINSGQSVARNMGIKLAKGKFIYFMDSDDVLEPNSLQYIIDLMEVHDLDLYVFDGKSFLEKSKGETLKIIHYDKKHSFGLYNTGKSLFSDLVGNRVFSVSPCLYLTRRNLIIENNISFIEGIVHEDEAFTVEIFLNAEKSLHENKTFFNRRIRSESTMTRPRSKKNFMGYYTVFKYLHRYLDFEPIRKRLASIFNSIYDIFWSLSKKDQQEVEKEYMNTLICAEKNNFYSFSSWLKHKNKFTNTVYTTLAYLKNRSRN